MHPNVCDFERKRTGVDRGTQTYASHELQRKMSQLKHAKTRGTLTCFEMKRHETNFRPSCLAASLGDKLHEPLQRVTHRAMANIVAKQVADIIAESKTQFYYSV